MISDTGQVWQVDDLEAAAIVAEAAGRSAEGVRVSQLGGRQGLLTCRVRLSGGESFVLKVVRESARRELMLTAEISALSPHGAEWTPRVVACEEDTRRSLYWLVTEDAGDVTVLDRPSAEAYAAAASTLASLQIAALDSLDRFGELGLRTVAAEDWENVALRVLESSAQPAAALIPTVDLEQAAWSAGEAARDALMIPASLVHGDLHAGNIALPDPGSKPPVVRLMDWGTAYVGAAFLGLEELLWPAARHLRSQEQFQLVRTAYLRPWSALLGKSGRLERPLSACRFLVRLHVLSQTLTAAEAPDLPADPFQAAAVFRKVTEAYAAWQGSPRPGA